MSLLAFVRRVRVLLPFGAAGDEWCPDPLYHTDPHTRMIHKADCRYRNRTEYTYSTLEEAVRAGGNPCWTCLQDWEGIVERERG